MPALLTGYVAAAVLLVVLMNVLLFRRQNQQKPKNGKESGTSREHPKNDSPSPDEQPNPGASAQVKASKELQHLIQDVLQHDDPDAKTKNSARGKRTPPADD